MIKGTDCISEAEVGSGAGFIKANSGWCNRSIYTPAEAAPLLNEDDNQIIMIFKKINQNQSRENRTVDDFA